ncbi:hypothetical protein DER45DRAFT_97158 [Fusarium avenaceum]|nr:hypothetical protein DER45DRAFT_97158 [Fusarium avenaceum]
MTASSDSSDLNSVFFNDTSRALNDDEREEFITRIWDTKKEYNSRELSAFFDFLEDERKTAAKQGLKFTFEDFFTLRNILYKYPEKSWTEILEKVRNENLAFIPGESVGKAIILIIRSFLLIRAKFCESNVYVYPGELAILQDESLNTILQKFRNPRSIRDGSAIQRYPRWFNAIDLSKKAEMRIEWTDYITDHLTIQGGVLLLFRHSQALKYMENSAILTSDFFGRDFITETRRSVLLFFPPDREGLHPNGLNYYHWMTGGAILKYWQLELLKDSGKGEISTFSTDYPVWHQKLDYILEVSQSQSNLSLSSIWYDDRDQALWWTRWALITAVFFAIVFGLIQSITGIMQVT